MLCHYKTAISFGRLMPHHLQMPPFALVQAATKFADDSKASIAASLCVKLGKSGSDGGLPLLRLLILHKGGMHALCCTLVPHLPCACIIHQPTAPFCLCLMPHSACLLRMLPFCYKQGD